VRGAKYRAVEVTTPIFGAMDSAIARAVGESDRDNDPPRSLWRDSKDSKDVDVDASVRLEGNSLDLGRV